MLKMIWRKFSKQLVSLLTALSGVIAVYLGALKFPDHPSKFPHIPPQYSESINYQQINIFGQPYLEIIIAILLYFLTIKIFCPNKVLL